MKVTVDKNDNVTGEVAIVEVQERPLKDSNNDEVAGEAKDTSEKVFVACKSSDNTKEQNKETFHSTIDEVCPDHIYEQLIVSEKVTDKDTFNQISKVEPEPTLTKADFYKFLSQFKLSNQN